ncbi:helix-turn-helix domain-containing protein [Pseudomonas aeruginosa]|uniref:helix-turn-helix domain-containing protein n=1 Tax=Pseudomonas aeruginosa TaxID=287 RepID=UPI00255C13F5|nr:helix-turn-helix transcriptional regulator [Pseudomonas aeruginosa]MDL4541111.1 helix-turn-helix transcriptional regulator [Pseudomonas aeruginosa]
MAGIPLSTYKNYEHGKQPPPGDRIGAIARTLGVSADELVFEESERQVADELTSPIQRGSTVLPPDDHENGKPEWQSGAANELCSRGQLARGSSLNRETKVGYHLYPTFQPRHPRPPPPKPHQRARNDASRKRRLPARQKNSRAATGLRDSPRDMAGRNGSRPHIVRTVVLRAERNGRSTEVRLNKVVRALPLLSRSCRRGLGRQGR